MAGRRRYAVCAALLQVAWLSACDQAADRAPVAVAAPQAETRVAAARPAGPERLVVAFGDSLYAGYQLAPGESLADALQAELREGGVNATVVNAGVSGDTSAAGRQRLAFTLDNLTRSPDLVVLGLGGNDMLRGLPVEETRANLSAIMDELSRRNIPVVLTGMLAAPNLGPDYAGRFNAIFPALARAHDATLDPFILAGVIGDRALMLDDGIHPNADGVARIAARVAPLVADRLPAE